MNETTSPSPSLSPPDRFTSPVPVPLPATPRTPPARPPMRPPQIPERPRTPPLVAEAPSGRLLAGIPIEKSIEQPWDLRHEGDAEVTPVLTTSQASVECETPAGAHRRDKVLYVRVNPKEKSQVIADAQASGLKLSPYLRKLTLIKRMPPTVEEREQLEALQMMFKRLEISVRRLHAEATNLRLFAVVPQMEEDFDAALVTTRGLIRELGKRLS